MDDENVAHLLELAARRASLGDVDGAIELLRRALSGDPDHAGAHAQLALCLVRKKRLVAAEHEAGAALAAEPDHPFAQYAMASVRLAQRRLGDARRHLDEMRAADPTSVAALRLLATVHATEGDRRAARAALAQARELDPDDAEVVVQLGDHALQEGRVDEADGHARAALAIDPESVDAHVLAGFVALRRGDAATAREHAISALHAGAHDPDALRLMVAVKARESLVLGLWWRFATFMGEQGDARSIAMMLAMYLGYRVVEIAARQADRPGLASVATILWLAFCAYTWIGPGLFARAVRKELDEVRLKDY